MKAPPGAHLRCLRTGEPGERRGRGQAGGVSTADGGPALSHIPQGRNAHTVLLKNERNLRDATSSTGEAAGCTALAPCGARWGLEISGDHFVKHTNV